MIFILDSLAETAGVILIGLLGYSLGRWFSQLPDRRWLLGYTGPFFLLALIGSARWVPWLGSMPPFEWIMMGRIEFAALAPIITTLFATTLYRLSQRRKRIAVGCFMVFATAYYSVLPFLSPVFLYNRLSQLEGTMTKSDICLQSTGYTCGPAAAVTALHAMGISAKEGTIAIQAHTSPFAGTPLDQLCGAIQENYDVSCRTEYFADLADMPRDALFIAVIKFRFLIDHYVVVLDTTEDGVVVADPLHGKSTWSRDKFTEKYRGQAIVFPERTRTK